MSGITRSDIEDILALIDKSDFDELRLEIGDLKLELRRRGAGLSAPGGEIAAAPAAEPAVPVAKVQAVAAPVTASGPGTPVPSPLLGTFYRAPKPGADPFVRVGDAVTPDTVVGIIEVMKLMNSVTAGMTGTVAAILVNDGELVEHGQPLVAIQPG